MKTKHVMGGVDMSLSGPCLLTQGPQSMSSMSAMEYLTSLSIPIPLTSSGSEMSETDPMDHFQYQYQMMSPEILTPTEEVETERNSHLDLDLRHLHSTPSNSNPSVVPEDDDDLDLDPDDSEWEDIDEDEDDDCILFLDDDQLAQACTNSINSISISNGFLGKDCFNSMALNLPLNGFPMMTSASTVSTSTSTPKFSSSGEVVGVGIGFGIGFVCGNYPKGPKNHKSNHFWGSKLAKKCRKQFKHGHQVEKVKRVQFNDKDLVQVIEFEDNDELKESRKPYWERFAIDRCRFKERIRKTEEEISPVFSEEHRNLIYSQRVLPYLKSLEEQEKFSAQVPACPLEALKAESSCSYQNSPTAPSEGASGGRKRRRNRKRRKKSNPTVQ